MHLSKKYVKKYLSQKEKEKWNKIKKAFILDFRVSNLQAGFIKS